MSSRQIAPTGADEEEATSTARRTRSPRPSEDVAGHIHGLDGIRAIAVAAVVVYHLLPSRLPGGFLGVDVFFVISGFLITTLLLRESGRNGRIDLPRFWLRRARRLLPALVLVVTASVVAARIVDPNLLVGIGRQTLGALTFSSNWVEIHAGADYFDATSPALFLTFWSLAVEEQFYVFWPLIVVAILTVTRTTRGPVRFAIGLAAASATLMAVLYEPGGNPTRAYYGTDSHMFGLMLGASLAFAFSGDVGILARPRWLYLRRWVGFAALGGLLVMFLAVDSAATLTYRGGIVIASLLSAVMVASLPGPQSAFSALHRLRPLSWVGERSYGIYLWHWPVILLVAASRPAVAPGADPALSTVIISLVLTLALSEASYRWVEMPVRTHGFRDAWAGLRSVRPALVGAIALVALAALTVATAPSKSAAQLAVEQGEAAIAAQATAPVPATSAPSTSATAGSGSGTGPAPAWPTEQAVPPGELISGFGDSVLSGAAPAVYERFPGIALDAEPIRQWHEAPALVQSALDAGTVRPVVILQFGTNAGLKTQESRDALNQVLDMLGPDRRVVLINTVGVSGWVPETNATLAEISASRPNTAVMDWNATVEADPSLLHDDRTHPNMEGIGVYAEQIAQTLEELGPQ